jgi:hypothetical protein
VRTAVRDELKKAGALMIPYSAYPHGMPGVPDLLCCYRGIFLGVEIKRPEAGSQLTPRQLAVHHLIRQAGGYVVVARGREDAANAVRVIDAVLGRTGVEGTTWIAAAIYDALS